MSNKAAACDLSGVWMPTGQNRVLDDRLAIAKGRVDQNGDPTPHGTWVRINYFRIMPGPDNTLITVFDEVGNFARFLWNGEDRWISQPDEVTFTVKGTLTFDKISTNPS